MKKRKLDPAKIKRILIRSTNWVGDAVLTTPAIRAVRKNFPCAEITILAKPWVAPVFHGNRLVDNIMAYDSGGRHKGIIGMSRLIRLLRREKFDLGILFQNAFEAAFLAYMAGIPLRLGFDTDCRGFLLSHPVRLEPGDKEVHEIDYYLAVLERASLKPDGRGLTVAVSDEERRQAGDILETYGITGRDRVVVGINPGAAYGSAKRWPVERFAAVCDEIGESRGSDIVIFGGPGEKNTGRQVSGLTKRPCVNLCGKTTLREAIALIERCELFITNDSGLMHVAAALGVPVVAVFGPTNPVTTGPSSPESCIVQVPASCSPCLKPECPGDHRCMRDITVDMVLESAREVMEKRP